MDQISLTEARKNFSRIVALAKETGSIAVTVHGKPEVCIVPYEQYKRLVNAAIDKEFDEIFKKYDEVFKALSDR